MRKENQLITIIHMLKSLSLKGKKYHRFYPGSKSWQGLFAQCPLFTDQLLSVSSVKGLGPCLGDEIRQSTINILAFKKTSQRLIFVTWREHGEISSEQL